MKYNTQFWKKKSGFTKKNKLLNQDGNNVFVPYEKQQGAALFSHTKKQTHTHRRGLIGFKRVTRSYFKTASVQPFYF